MTIVDREVLLPTVLSLWETAGRPAAGVDEVDIVFFAPPAPGVLRRRSSVRRDEESGRIDRTVAHLDAVGRLVAEVHSSGPLSPVEGGAEDDPVTGALLRSVAGRFETADVRRVRMRVHGRPAADRIGEPSTTVLQRYRTDHEHVEDVAVVFAEASGAVIVRAWVTVAVGS
ncbi:hypothetical protein OED52_17375 [Rhodococcus sp. Z13]|uniref:Uncharacterized protein n=1 Tax=Rhodococcus sacchari TaxID=2962047 RepID=A0ACD4DEC0_9NOCA|nr:hypothetical protein [Rhodococcus sp. Z13]UYP18410.1 hypothetical protein OED52_17375 [Rhodococcus sp. Z13]